MAKLHKIEMYILDIDEHYGSLQDTIDHINDRLELVSLHPFNINTVEFDWSDDHRLNQGDVGYNDYKDMFENNTIEYPYGICLCCKQVKHVDQMFQYIDGERYMCFDCY